ncbi:cytochrome c oxidase subunit II [Halobacteriales archaeon QH_3_68_24]|nr:MAG: cytochrome c oxidase subunit II [Halobacteriales archaeon QH_3_68_24]
MAVPPVGVSADVVLAGVGGIRAPAEVFQRIFLVFLGLGTLVGTVVISYTLYNAYKYRYREDADPAPDADRPELGELPEGGGKGKKLFLSFGLSAIVVLSLVAWTYGALVMVEDGGVAQAEGDVDSIDVRVEGYQFGWEFIYPNGHVEDSQAGGKLYVPADTVVNLTVTSQDVHHNFGIPDLRIKSDAIPGQTTDAWFVAEETGTHTANCYELCGQGHSYMDAEVVVMEEAQFQDWYANTTGSETDATNSTEAAE